MPQERQPAFRLTVKDDAFVLTARDDGGESVYTYDRAGRLFAAWTGERFYRRGLDGRMLAKHTVREGSRRVAYRRRLPPREVDAFVDRAAHVAVRTQAALARGEAELLWSSPAPASIDEGLRLLSLAAAFDARAAREDSAQFERIYRPVGILPPDQYLAVVVQLTEGCHWNRCAFCTFYRDVPFHVKTVDELEAHLRAAHAYLGDGLSLRRSVFLGEANALHLPTDDLVMRLEVVRRWFTPDGRHGRSLYSFLDIFTGRRKTAGEFAELRVRGLRRVYLGVESGDDALLRFLNKPQRADHAADLVRALKAAGLSVGVIVMAGVGGTRFGNSHVTHTVDLLNALPLDRRDLIYISAFVDPPHSDYERNARAAGSAPLDALQIHGQAQDLRSGLRFDSNGPRVARYDIEEFMY